MKKSKRIKKKSLLSKEKLSLSSQKKSDTTTSKKSINTTTLKKSINTGIKRRPQQRNRYTPTKRTPAERTSHSSHKKKRLEPHRFNNDLTPHSSPENRPLEFHRFDDDFQGKKIIDLFQNPMYSYKHHFHKLYFFIFHHLVQRERNPITSTPISGLSGKKIMCIISIFR